VVMVGLRAMGRDNARTPVQWDDGPHAGFTTGTPWLAVNPNHTRINAAAQYDDPDSVFHHYRRLVELRHTRPVVALGDFRMILPDHPRLYCYERALDDARLLVLANLGPGEESVELEPGWAAEHVVLANTNRVRVKAGRAELGPWEALVLER